MQFDCSNRTSVGQNKTFRCFTTFVFMLRAINKYTPGQKGLWVLDPLTFCCIGPGCLLSDNEFLAFSLMLARYSYNKHIDF